MTKKRRLLSFILALTMLLLPLLASCNTQTEPPSSETTGQEEPTEQVTEEYTLPLEDGYNQLTIYFNHNLIN